MDVKTAARVFEMIEVFAALRRPLTISELAEHLGIPTSSCFGLVKTAEARGYLCATRKRGPVYPTRRLLELMQLIVEDDPGIEWTRSYLVALREATDETCVLGALSGRQVSYLDVHLSRQMVRYAPEVGEQRPIHANSLGKALLSLMPEPMRAALIGQLDRRAMTDATLTDPEAIVADVEAGIARGWHENFGESSLDLGAIARPITLNGRGYAISIGGPVERILRNRAALSAELMRICKLIERDAAQFAPGKGED